MSRGEITVWQQVRDAVQRLGGGPVSRRSVRQWIKTHYPTTNQDTVTRAMRYSAVNDPGRTHWAVNQKPGREAAPHDCLFRTDRDHLELYDPKKHGGWAIVTDGADAWTVVKNRG